MKSCDTCPGGSKCAGSNMHPVLMRVFELYSGGTTDKFDILFSLGPENEELLERFDAKLSPCCWSKTALLAIADIINASVTGPDSTPPPKASFGARVRAALATAVDSFKQFPWAVKELAEQAPELYQAIMEQTGGDAFAEHMSKRNFGKLCKEVAYR